MNAARDNLNREWKRRFEQFGQRYSDDAAVAGWSHTGLTARIRRFEHLLKFRPGSGTWVDVGCGAGTYCRLLEREGLDVLGVDYSLPSILHARENHSGGRYLVADASSLPFRTESLDGVVCLGVTQAFEDWTGLVGELLRVLKPGGQLWLDSLNAGSLVGLLAGVRSRLLRAPRRLHFLTARDVVDYLRDNGCTDVKCYWLPVFPARLSGLQHVIEKPFFRSVFDRGGSWVAALMSHSALLHAVKGNVSERVRPSSDSAAASPG